MGNHGQRFAKSQDRLRVLQQIQRKQEMGGGEAWNWGLGLCIYKLLVITIEIGSKLNSL